MPTASPRLLLFDVNETLLDLAVLEPLFRATFGEADARRAWFATLKEIVLVSTLTGDYRDFSARAALEMTATQRDASLAHDGRAILDAVRALPPHADVPAALTALRDAGFRLAALTNRTLDAARAQLRHAGLDEAVLSADEVRWLKPAPEPYAMAVRRLGVAPGDVRMVAAHGWDLAGARAAGLRTAFVARAGQTLDP